MIYPNVLEISLQGVCLILTLISFVVYQDIVRKDKEPLIIVSAQHIIIGVIQLIQHPENQ
ncbi:MAG: hypothetical protein CMG80_04255 [Marinobacter sp.]|nr:hypothetical protein [Marinobacter sp.]